MEKILNYAIMSNASDIHIYPHISGQSFIKLRVLGQLTNYENFSNSELESIISLLKYNASIDISKNKEPQSGRFVYSYNTKKYSLRVSTLPLSELLEGCVVRIFTDDISDTYYSIIENDNEKISALANRAYGLVLFSGPTGSGKSTSMYKLADEIAKNNRQVITIEDPVEKNIPSLIQMQVNDKAGINYNNALKSILRCDPDVIVVGEIRDEKTAKQVITSSLSGHLVLSTIHAEDTKGVINRLRDLGLLDEDIKQTIIAIIAQRLVKLTTGKRGLITEIISKKDVQNYVEESKIEISSLAEKFTLCYEQGKIDSYEKEKWGY